MTKQDEKAFREFARRIGASTATTGYNPALIAYQAGMRRGKALETKRFRMCLMCGAGPNMIRADK